MRTIFYCLGLLLVAQACTITEHYDIHKDLSGSYSLVFDMSEVPGSSLMDEQGPSESTALRMDSVKRHLNSIEGISKVDVSFKDGVIRYAYDFESPEAYNQARNRELLKRTDNGLALNVNLKNTIEEGREFETEGDGAEEEDFDFEKLARMMKYEVTIEHHKKLEPVDWKSLQRTKKGRLEYKSTISGLDVNPSVKFKSK